MSTVGYARVSSVGQSLDVQLDKLKDCEKVFQEKRTGTSNTRPRLKACLEYVRDGDTLVGVIKANVQRSAIRSHVTPETQQTRSVSCFN